MFRHINTPKVNFMHSLPKELVPADTAVFSKYFKINADHTAIIPRKPGECLEAQFKLHLYIILKTQNTDFQFSHTQ